MKYRIRAICYTFSQYFVIQRKEFWGWRTIRSDIYGSEDAVKMLETIKSLEAK